VTFGGTSVSGGPNARANVTLGSPGNAEVGVGVGRSYCELQNLSNGDHLHTVKRSASDVVVQ